MIKCRKGGEQMKKKYLVTKSNTLIMKKYNLDLLEQKLILILISMIEPGDVGFKCYQLKVTDLCKLLKVNYKGYHGYFYKLTKKLVFKGVEVINENGNPLSSAWLSSCEYKVNEGIIECEISEKLKPFLLELKEKFTKYKLENILNLNSKYSIRLYEICKSHYYLNTKEISVEELKYIMDAEKYKRWSNFKQMCLDVAVEEINKKTDICIKYSSIKEGRSITALRFSIKDNIGNDKINADENCSNILNHLNYNKTNNNKSKKLKTNNFSNRQYDNEIKLENALLYGLNNAEELEEVLKVKK